MFLTDVSRLDLNYSGTVYHITLSYVPLDYPKQIFFIFSSYAVQYSYTVATVPLKCS